MGAVETASAQRKHAQLNDLVTLAEAAVGVCFQVEDSPARPITSATLNMYAIVLSRLVTLYAISEDREQIRSLALEDIAGGVFRDGGREVYFADGRETIRGLAVTRVSLKAAIEAMRRVARLN
jgi:hypothetical protein